MDGLTELAHDLTDKYFHCPMKIGKTLKHPDGRMIRVKSGCFRDSTYNRISNWWSWNEVLPNGKLGPEESGYGWSEKQNRK